LGAAQRWCPQPEPLSSSSALAERLAASAVPAARWVGKDALRDLERSLVARRAGKRESARLARAAKRATR
jgi:hypothetical protein